MYMPQCKKGEIFSQLPLDGQVLQVFVLWLLVLRSILDFSTLRNTNRAAVLGLDIETTGW